jgi:hypothetical protein
MFKALALIPRSREREKKKKDTLLNIILVVLIQLTKLDNFFFWHWGLNSQLGLMLARLRQIILMTVISSLQCALVFMFVSVGSTGV